MALASSKALLLLAGAEHSLWLLLFQLAEKLRVARRQGKSFFVVRASKIFIRRGGDFLFCFSRAQIFVNADTQLQLIQRRLAGSPNCEL
jgi:hypothetical protein